MCLENKDIPVLFVHSGKQGYLKRTIRLAQEYNKRVFLLGDQYNKGYCNNWIEQGSLSQDRFDKFKNLYRHMSTNPYIFELNCFKRFYLIYEYMKVSGESKCILLDSDLCTL